MGYCAHVPTDEATRLSPDCPPGKYPPAYRMPAPYSGGYHRTHSPSPSQTRPVCLRYCRHYPYSPATAPDKDAAMPHQPPAEKPAPSPYGHTLPSPTFRHTPGAQPVSGPQYPVLSAGQDPVSVSRGVPPSVPDNAPSPPHSAPTGQPAVAATAWCSAYAVTYPYGTRPSRSCSGLQPAPVQVSASPVTGISVSSSLTPP